MDFAAFADAMQDFANSEIVADLNLGDLIHNSWFLGGMGVLALLALICKWRTLLALILGITGTAWLISYTVSRGPEISAAGSRDMAFFVGGAVLVVIVMIYLIFIRNE